MIDVRPESEYRAGHIPGAISIPVAELKARLKELPKQREIVAYCRGPYCVMAIDAVELLRNKGFKAQRLEDGVIEWRARGFRVETQFDLIRRVGAVAGKTFIGQDGTDVAVEINALLSARRDLRPIADRYENGQ